DVVLLTADNLLATAFDTQNELGLTHSLHDVLAGWPGPESGLLLIDGLDQPPATRSVVWLSKMVSELRGTRWRIVATIRSFDLEYSPRWKSAFRVDTPGVTGQLAEVHRYLVGGFTDDELSVVRARSVTLAALLATADPSLVDLLRNPF